MELTARQQRFCAEYIRDLNATKAAARAGYSPRTARSIGSENLAKPDIQAEIRRLKAERAERLMISADRVVEELARIAFSNIEDLFNADGSLKGIGKLSPDTAAAIANIETTESGATRVRLFDKLRALELLGKHLGLFDGPADNGKEDVFTSFMRDVQARRAAVPVRP